MKKAKELQLVIFISMILLISWSDNLFSQTYTLQDNDVVIEEGVIMSCNYDFTMKNIVIPESLQGQTVIGITDAENWSKGVFCYKDIDNVILPATIEFIGDYAFANNDIFALDLSQFSSLRRIGKSAFKDNNIKELYFDDCTSLQIIGELAFRSNYIDNINFDDCINLYTIDNMAFYGNHLSSINLMNCHQLTFIGVKAFTGNFAGNIALPYCTGFESYGWMDGEGSTYPPTWNVDNFDTFYYVPYSYTMNSGDLTVENGIIKECHYDFKFKQIIIPEEIDGEIITGIADGNSQYHGVFFRKNIVSVSLPSKLKHIGNNAFAYNSILSIDFSGCDLLETIGMSSFRSNYLKSVNFNGCASLRAIDKYAFLDHSMISLDLSSCLNLDLIGYAAFKCDTWTENLLTSINLSGCVNLKTISSSAFSYHSASYIDLSSCNSLTYIGRSSFYGDNLMEIALPVCAGYESYGWKDNQGNLFQSGASVSELSNFYYVPYPYTLKDFDVIIENGIIMSCRRDIGSKLLTIPGELQGQTVTGIGDGDSQLNGVFARRSLIEVQFPETIKYIGDDAFSENSFLELSFDGLDELKVIGKNAFYSVWDVDNLNLNDCSALEYIGDRAFFGNRFGEIKLTQCTSLHHIGNGAFCENGPDRFELPVVEGYEDLDWVDGFGNTYQGGDTVYTFCTSYYVPIKYYLNDEDVEIINGVILSVSYPPNYFDIGIPEILQEQFVTGIVDASGRNTGVFESRELKSVELPETMRYIGERGFYNNSMEIISLNDCDKLQYIGPYAFGNNNLVSFELPTASYTGFEYWEDNTGTTFEGNDTVNMLYNNYVAKGDANLVIFEVITEDNNPVSNASLNFNSQIKLTNSEGKAEFNNIFDGNYSYLLNSSEYNPETGELNIVNDTTIQIILPNLGYNEKKNEVIKIFPNPASDAINIISEYTFNEVEILNLHGEVVKKHNMIEGKRIEVSDLIAGLYFVRISNAEDRILTQRFVKL
jgi:Leucine Rich Repeat (LRR) protein/type IX secretion system substrate protein